MSDDQQFLKQFAGTARLFPLPNLVLFPNVVQPLHVFEPRYRELTAESLLGDRLIALALLRPGWESDYDGRPPLYPIACLGRVIADQRLPDGRFNLLLRGISRLQVHDELADSKLFRTARAKLLVDRAPSAIAEAMRLRRDLADRVLPRFAATGAARDQLQELFAGELPLGPLCDILSFALPLAVEDKQGLLEQLDVSLRASRLIELIDSVAAHPIAAGDRKFPPDFSSN